MGKLQPLVYGLTKIAISKNRNYKKKLTFGPQFSGQNCTFSSLAANWSHTGQWFYHKKVPHWFPDMRVPNVLLHPPKKWSFGPKMTFLAKYRHFWPILSNGRPENAANKVPRCYFLKISLHGYPFTNLRIKGENIESIRDVPLYQICA